VVRVAVLLDALPGSRDRCSKCGHATAEHGPFWFLQTADEDDNAIVLCRSCWQDAIRVFNVVSRSQFDDVSARARKAEEYAVSLEQVIGEVPELRERIQTLEDRNLSLASQNEALLRWKAEHVAGEPRRRREKALAQVRPTHETEAA
jgi:hypothetical protein